MSDFPPYASALKNLRRLAVLTGQRAAVATITHDVNLIEADRRAWEAEAGTSAGAEPEPSAGADVIVAHPQGSALADTLAGPLMLAPGDLRVVLVDQGHNGPLELDARHAGLSSSVLRIAGPAGSSIGAITVPDYSGVRDLTLELWGVAVEGDVRVVSSGFALRVVYGARISAARDAGQAVPL
jgi:hypothetical protein